jgi:hypothetical protein
MRWRLEMKKAIFSCLVFSLLLVLENLFAQDALSFEKKFSLSIQSKTFVLFWNQETSLTAINSFYEEKGTYPAMKPAYKIFGNDLDLEGTHPIINVASIDVHNRKYGLQKEKMYSPSLAEGYLRRLAERKKKSRRTRGTVGLIGGGICLALGAATLSSVEEEAGWEGFWVNFGKGAAGSLLVATGVVGVIGGALSLVIPSGAERELGDVLRISDVGQRERASHDALSSLAARGKTSRILTSIAFAGFSAYSLFRKESNYDSAGIFGAFAVYSLIRKTPEERVFQNYEKEREQQKRLRLRLGFSPKGGAYVCLSLSY